MRNIINIKTRRLLAVAVGALGAAIIAIGCSGSGGEGAGSGLSDMGNKLGNGLGTLGRGGATMFNNAGNGLQNFGNSGGGQQNDLGTWLNIGQKFFAAADLDNPQRQEELGQSCALAVGNSYPLSTNNNRNDYVNMVGMTVASVSEKPELEYSFAILESPDINAYSTPGGYVFITRGALEACADESELAAVLGHEVAHVVLNHGIEQIKNEKWTELGMTVASTQSKEFREFEQVTDKMAEKVLTGVHSNEQEYKADSEAVNYLIAAGYDPNGMTRFLMKLQAKTGAGDISNVMKTHPGTAERVKRVQQQIASAPAGGAALPDRFARWTH